MRLSDLRRANRRAIHAAGPRYMPGQDRAAPNLQIAAITEALDAVALAHWPSADQIEKRWFPPNVNRRTALTPDNSQIENEAMKRAAKLNALPIPLDPSAAAPLWCQLSIGLRVAIANGRLGPGARLPSTRELARRLNVSRTTVMTAFEDLAARGLLFGYTGAGSYVASTVRTIARVQVWFQDDSGNLLTLAPLA